MSPLQVLTPAHSTFFASRRPPLSKRLEQAREWQPALHPKFPGPRNRNKMFETPTDLRSSPDVIIPLLLKFACAYSSVSWHFEPAPIRTFSGVSENNEKGACSVEVQFVVGCRLKATSLLHLSSSWNSAIKDSSFKTFADCKTFRYATNPE